MSIEADVGPLVELFDWPLAGPEARTNVLTMLGTLGQATPTTGGPLEEAVAGLLLRAVGDAQVVVQAEALNAVMDVYCDDARHPAFLRHALLPRLRDCLRGFKAKVKSEGVQVDREVQLHLKETKLNIARFISYKISAANT
uniref:SYO1-like TPR repeats domain-containing protein n=1 Tax=Fibrocapsa japonica TaxID=94617 RepID=A0A7S2V006_9STRA